MFSCVNPQWLCRSQAHSLAAETWDQATGEYRLVSRSQLSNNTFKEVPNRLRTECLFQPDVYRRVHVAQNLPSLQLQPGWAGALRCALDAPVLATLPP